MSSLLMQTRLHGEGMGLCVMYNLSAQSQVKIQRKILFVWTTEMRRLDGGRLICKSKRKFMETFMIFGRSSGMEYQWGAELWSYELEPKWDSWLQKVKLPFLAWSCIISLLHPFRLMSIWWLSIACELPKSSQQHWHTNFLPSRSLVAIFHAEFFPLR